MSRLVKWARTHKAAAVSLSILPSLPTELLLEILAAADDKTLHMLARVSRRFYALAKETLLLRNDIQLSSRSVSITSSEALRALRLALALRDDFSDKRSPLDTLEYLPRAPLSNAGSKNLRRLQALFTRLSSSVDRIPDILLTFSHNLIQRPVGWNMAIQTPKLLQYLCGESPVAVIVSTTAIFTLKVPTLHTWSPYTRDPYCKLELHGGPKQWVPTIRSIVTIHAHYPFGPGDPFAPPIAPDPEAVASAYLTPNPALPWTLLVIDKATITTLFLDVDFYASTWDSILLDPALVLPELHTLSVWAPGIMPQATVAFLNRHSETLTTLTYMPRAGKKASRRIDFITTAGTWPKFSKLTALAPDVDVLFGSTADTAEHFPSLTHVEIWPDDSHRFYAGLRWASRHLGLDTLTLCFLAQEDIPIPSSSEYVPAANHLTGDWPVFPNVQTLVLNKTTALSSPARIAGLIAKVFPALNEIQIVQALVHADGTATPAEEMTRLTTAFERSLSESLKGVRCTFE
ncbi:hypothetical protein C8F01DRAFT_1318141 [Mycena amicta]|nr:hypothetical protein C8F01DRAFT_1318141 [Mycena amicta]